MLTRNKACVALYVYIVYVNVRARQAEKARVDGGDKTDSASVCLWESWKERLDSIRAEQWVVYLCEQVHAWQFIDSTKL